MLEKVILPQYVLYNHGRWPIYLKDHLKDHLEFIGWFGLKYVDPGYRFKKSAWGKGYATEAAFVCLKHGFKKLNIARITRRTVPENVGSWRVLEKTGMGFIREELAYGQWFKTYELANPSII